MDHKNSPRVFVPCRVCHQDIMAIRFLNHARFKHPVEWEKWRPDRGAFGQSARQHFNFVVIDDMDRIIPL